MAGARDQFAALLSVRERVEGPEHPGSLAARHDLAFWTGRRGTRLVPATSSLPCCPSTSASRDPGTRTPLLPATISLAGPGMRGMRLVPVSSSLPCCPCVSGSSALSTPKPWTPAMTSPTGPARRGMRLAPVTSMPSCCPSASGSRALSTPTPGCPPRPRLLDRAGGGRGWGPRPVRRAAARPRAGPRPRPSRQHDHKQKLRLLGGTGRGLIRSDFSTIYGQACGFQ